MVRKYWTTSPAAILLKQVHGPKEIKGFVEPNNQLDTFQLYKSYLGKLRPIFFDFVTFVNNANELVKKYKEWLKNIIDWYIPRSVRAIIYDKDDDASRLLYKHFTELLGQSNNIKTVNIKGKLDDVDKSGAVIVLLPVMSRGNSLVKLNSDLRLIEHNAQRIFVTPFAISPNNGDYTAFKNSLVFGPNSLKYQFLNFRSVFIGHERGGYSWDLELEVVDGFTHELFRERTVTLQEQSVGLLNDVGVSCNSNDKKLVFNKDFAFWPGNYEPNKVNLSAVYVTVSTILQKLREQPPATAGNDSLFAQVYQHSVLDPDNFSRFNDPLLQSCLWRCAYSRELDYRSDDNLGNKFVNILTRLAQCRFDGEHNATLDLLIGLATRKIQLSTTCRNNLVAELRNILNGIDPHLEVLNYIDNDYKHSPTPDF